MKLWALPLGLEAAWDGDEAAATSGHQSQKGRENIPVAGTDRRRGELRASRALAASAYDIVALERLLPTCV
eukprot:376224-Prorocentrum_minimum.AAC.1